MKSQSILLLLASLAILAHDVTCDDNEKNESENGGKQNKLLSEMALNGIAMASSTTWTASSTVVPSVTASLPTSIPTGVASVLSAVVSEASVINSAAVSAASSLAASVGAISSSAVPSGAIPSGAIVSAASSIPSGIVSAVTRPASSGASAAALPSVARPYAGPSVISSSNHKEVSVTIATIGICCAFLLTLA